MSWQATAWAIKQTTGSTRRKALLLALANYADANGVCWPSQERLAADTEQSADSVQRHSGTLEAMKLLRRVMTPKWRGQHSGYRYYLAIRDHSSSNTTVEAAPTNLRFGHAAKHAEAGPQGLRHKPSKEPSYKHPPTESSFQSVEVRQRAFQQKQEPLEIVQNRIAQRIGDDGWLVLGDMHDTQRTHLSKLERQGKLDEDTLRNSVLAVRCASKLSLPPKG